MGKMIGESDQAGGRPPLHHWGTGEYTDDIVLPRMTHAYILRSHWRTQRSRALILQRLKPQTEW